MPYYEVTVTCSKCVLVQADDESDAEDKAVDQFFSDWNNCEAESESEVSKEDEKEYLEDYKQKGDFIK